MAVLIQRSKTTHIPQECVYGCCTSVYGKNVKKVRRTIKRAENQTWKRDVR